MNSRFFQLCLLASHCGTTGGNCQFFLGGEQKVSEYYRGLSLLTNRISYHGTSQLYRIVVGCHTSET
jgi:hypothetical protein